MNPAHLQETHWSEHTDRITPLVQVPRFGLISDFDGTLSPFVAHPADAVIDPQAAAALEALAPHLTIIALISGRAASDLHSRFPRPTFAYMGNHGLELWQEDGSAVIGDAREWEGAVEAVVSAVTVDDLPGVHLEHKGITASVHYRGTADPAAAREQLYQRLQPLAEAHGLRLSEGRQVWEIRPPVPLDKGTAAEHIVRTHALDAVLFLGDDATDVAAMRRLRAIAADPAEHLQALSVGVSHPNTLPAVYEACDLVADGIDDVTRLLVWLRECRLSPQSHSQQGRS